MSFQSRNPSTGMDLNTYPAHDETEIEDRLTLSAASWKSWSVTPLPERAVHFVRLATLLEERSEQYGRLITLEMGKPIGEAIAEVKKAALGARHFAEKATEYLAPQPIEGMTAHVAYEPLGPVFAVMPWNLPFWQVLRFFIPTALAKVQIPARTQN